MNEILLDNYCEHFFFLILHRENLHSAIVT